MKSVSSCLLAALFCVATAMTSPAQILTTLASFDTNTGYGPQFGLTLASDGNFYGTNPSGGPGNCYSVCGTLFRVTPSGVLTNLYTFCSQYPCPNGIYPWGTLVQGANGNLYGVAAGGGANCQEVGCGTVFEITLSGNLTTIHSFDETDGQDPVGLVQGANGIFYGATTYGGTSGNCFNGGGCGTIFRMTTSGLLTTLYNFCVYSGCTDGEFPSAPPIQAADGNLYGTTWSGGTGGGITYDCTGLCGTIFKLSTTGALTTLYNFCSQPYCVDGFAPSSVLVQGTDGNFYGTAQRGGANDNGTVFKITPTGTLTTLYNFCAQQACTDGSNPGAVLIQASDGNFYGTTIGGGASNEGTVFKITSTGQLTTIYNFCSLTNCTDGSGPAGAILQVGNGNFYGTTGAGGTNTGVYCPYGCGTVFRLTGPTATPFQLIAVTPCRLVDTRQTGTPILGGTWQSFDVPQLGSCNIPSTAAAYSLNVTVVPQGPLGYLTIWPTGEDQPLVSTMNSPDGRIKANAAIVSAGANGSVNVYVTNTTNLILDIDGYFTAPGSQTQQFYAIAPCRVVDTRAGSNEPPGLGPPSLQAQQQRDLPILSSPCLQGITNPQAYSFNVTVVPNPAGQPLGYLTVWPSNQTQPTVSTLNNPTATVVANEAIVPAAPDGDIEVYADNSSDLIIDISGYFGAPEQNGLSLYSVSPCRVLDTRNNNGQPFQGELIVNVEGGACAPPSNAQAYVFNATVVPPGSMPYLTLWADGQQQPVASTLNAYDGFITSNMAIVPNLNGSIDAYAAGLTQLILDLSGYFAP